MKKTKIIFAPLLALSLLLLPISAGAEETVLGEPTDAVALAEEVSCEVTLTDIEAAGGVDDSGAEVTSTDGSASPTEGDGEADTENPFEVALAELSGYATEIICTLSLIASLLLAYAYKKGLLPLISGALSAISKTLSGVKSRAEEGERELGEGLERLTALAASQEKRLDDWDGALKDACATLSEVAAECRDTARIKEILREEVEMLYDIFMSSSLPQYKKDAVAERIANMKRGLSGDDEE